AAREDLGAMLADARDGAERVRRIVRDLKTFSRGEDDRPVRLDVWRVLDVAAQLAQNEIRHRARLERDYEPVPDVRAGESQLGQVFLHLLVNAAQALPEGRAGEHVITLRTRTDCRGWALIEVADDGPGI